MASSTETSLVDSVNNLSIDDNELSKRKTSDADNQVEPEFEYADIDELLAERKGDIQKLRKLLGEACPKEDMNVFPYYDEIFFLRYVLSFKTPVKAVEPVKKTVAWRNDPENSWLELCADNGKEWEKESIVQTMMKYQVGGPHDCKKDGAPVIVIRPALGNPQAVYNHLTYEEQHKLHFAYREVSFRQCDAMTRKTRKMVKQMLIFDMNGVKFRDMMDRRGQKVHEPVSKACTNYYPQLQSKFVMKHPPGWIQVVVGLMKKILPKRNMDKMGICPASSGKGDVSKCPYASKYFIPEKVPEFLGGSCKDSELGAHISGSKVVKDEKEEGTEITISARSEETVEIDVPVGNVFVDWVLNLKGFGINMSAELHPEDPKDSVVVLRAKSTEEKIKADNGLAKGQWEAPFAGKLKITFDNSYSKLRSKTLRYSFDFRMKD